MEEGIVIGDDTGYQGDDLERLHQDQGLQEYHRAMLESAD